MTKPEATTEDAELRQSPAAFRAAVDIARRNWVWGALTFELPSGRELRIQGPKAGPDGRLIVRDFHFVSRVLASADIGFGEGFMAGEWDTPDLSALLEAFTLNFDRLEKLVQGSPVMRAVNRLALLVNRNSRGGARRNIHAHYDLGNAFYARWLDPSMTYSSARFERPGQSLSDAQRHKYATLAREIGLDYRYVEGKFDHVASIEMFEAVGEAYWPAYFAKVRDVLSPGGRAGLQIITIRDDLFRVYRTRSDFLRKYIFPGGMLPSERRLREEVDRAGLEWKTIARFGQNYADTLAQWAVSFESAWDEIRGLGFDERFRRLWRFYLSYCEAGFRAERTDVVQLGLARA